MKPKLKIGIQNLHHDEVTALKELFDDIASEFYIWPKHDYDKVQLKSCDVLIMFARRHWRYLKFNKPYLLILADYVTNEKAIALTKSRSINFLTLRYAYHSNSLFRGFLCGSSELFETVRQAHIPGFFYHKKYPFAGIYSVLKTQLSADPKDIVTLINSYQRTAGERKWRRPEDSYQAFQYVVKNVPQFHFAHYGAPENQKTFEESNELQAKARYTIHIKYWGHVCNAVVKSLALGVPVLMDEPTFLKGRYQAYLHHGKNAMIFKSKNEIITYLNNPGENEQWQKLKKYCTENVSFWHFPYSDEEKEQLSQWLEALAIGPVGHQ
ncbi:MAG: hypothetical protein OJF59_000770 [Cytophagales bacterium]|jgi:hypothetical protein|nr:hypothetical protein [Bacteroidota bacterium]MBS1979762.1 hypothetical protein [Bacteroidota bacterium]WHZ07017.1 MAG: hypothetical protein OJF59_000770 [Cytophagales bacterium]